jgi:hypothetical protein
MPKSKKEAYWVYVSEDGEGYTYTLFPISEDKLRAKYPKAQLSERLFLAQDVTQDFASSHQNTALQILTLLTQLSPDELRAEGPWEFRRPKKDELLFTWPNETSAGSSAQSPGTKKTVAPSLKSPRSAQRKAAG